MKEETDDIPRFTFEEIRTALQRELAESFPNKWRDRFYTSLGYLIGATNRILAKRLKEKIKT
jgi:hypothetical protein